MSRSGAAAAAEMAAGATAGGGAAPAAARGPVGVCHVITRLDLGGAQENTLHTVAHLAPPFRASLVAGPGGLLDDEARRLPVPITFVPSLVRRPSPVSDAAAFAALYRHFRRERPRIVHTHSSKAGILGRLAARAAGVPIVVHSIHGYGFNPTQPWAVRASYVGLERLAAAATTRFVAVSQATLETGVRLGLFRRERCVLIRSGIATEPFRRAAEARRPPASPDGDDLRRELGVPETTPLVGMIACLKPQKAPLDFVRVAARVAESHGTAVFVLAGDGELRSEVLRAAAGAGLAGRFHLLGWRRDVPRLMASLDVMVLTSLWEGLPRVVPEAIAAGVPIVATAVDGTADILRDGETGFCSPAGDTDGLASRVLRVLREPGLGRACAARASGFLPEFEIEAMVRAQEGLYRVLLGDGPDPRGAPYKEDGRL